MSYILNIGTAVPEHALSQDQFCDIYSSLTDNADIQRKIKFLTAKSAIYKRNCVEPDIIKLLELGVEQRLAIYHQQAFELAVRAIENNPSFEANKGQITDLIFISCTGMQAPGVEMDVINHFKLSPNISRYNVNFMGCYAAITGLRLANQICHSPSKKVLLVSVELCTLHFQNSFTDDYLLSNSIFADGAASVILASDSHHAKLKLENFESRLIPNTMDEMSWKISSHGFLMSLSSKVPSSIKKSLEQKNLFGLITDATSWAIHPGGKQIIDGISASLGLNEEEVWASRKVLKENGNMSSATVLFVICEMMNNRRNSKNKIVTCAFGPGLTLEAALLSYV